MEEELKEIVGEKETEIIMRDVKKDALETHNLVDIYYKVMPNRSVYFFKRYLVDNKLCIKRMQIQSRCLDSIEIEG